MYKFNYTPAAVGSGKTYRAAQWMGEHPIENVLYVVPSIKLAAGIREQIRELAPAHNDIRIINSENNPSSLNVRDKALNVINRVHDNVGRVTIITFVTFIQIISRIEKPQLWNLIMDESFKPVEHKKWDSTSNSELVEQFFNVDPVSKLASAKRGCSRVFNRIYEANDFNEVPELSATVLPDYISAIKNPATELRLLKREGSDYWHGFIFTKPDFFKYFKSVLIMSAMFEQSLLKNLWETVYDVKWDEHPYWKDICNLTHCIFGKKIKIGYLLPDNKGASSSLLKTTYSDGTKVIEKLLHVTSEYFDSNPYVVAVNKSYIRLPLKYSIKKDCILPPHAHGLNNWKRYNNIAALIVTNPTPELVEVIRFLLNNSMINRDIEALFRRDTIYQAIGRISIRDRNSTTDKTILVCGKLDAEYFNKLFEGSEMIGRVSDFYVPDVKSTYKPTGKPVGRPSGYPDHFERKDKQAWTTWVTSKKSTVYTPRLTMEQWYKQIRTPKLLK